MRVKGTITVFLTMIFLVVVSLVITTVESARMQASRMLMETSVDAAFESVLAGYDRELYDRYDVFLFDGAYGSANVSKAQLEEALDGYLQKNLKAGREFAMSNTDFYKVSAGEIAIGNVALATDNQGKVFREQAIASMRASMGMDVIQGLVNDYHWAVNNVSESSAYEQKEQEVEGSLTSLEDEKAQADAEKSAQAAAASAEKDPSAQVTQMKSMGILELVHPSPNSVSQKSVSLDMQPSHRDLNRGIGLQDYESDILSNVLFGSYLMKNFVHAASAEANTDGSLQYQLEYLLIGKAHDVDNLKGVVHQLLLIREGANFAYLLTDAGRVAQAYESAMLLVGYTCIPPLIEATKYAILLAWAYAESVLDVKVLLAGERTALVKSYATWRTSLSNLGELASMDPKQMGDKDGMSYGEYLQVMLLVANQDELAMRALDLVELDMRHITGNAGWKIDNHVSVLEASICMITDSVFLSLPFMQGLGGAVSKEMSVTRRFEYGIWQ